MRTRDDFKTLQRQVRQRLTGFLLRHSLRWTGGHKTGWSLESIVDALMAMRGINLVTAMGVVAELWDLSRFTKPTQLMAYLGLVPSEHSSGFSRQQGGIAKSGNGHVRRLLIESAWCCRFTACRSRD